MINAMRAESTKLVSTVMPWGFAALGLGLTAINVLLASNGDPAGLTQHDAQFSLSAAGATAGTFALLLGIVGMTGEDRHKTTTPSLLACPRRGRLIAAKMTIHATAGVLMTLAASAIGWILTSIVLSAKGIDMVVTGGDYARLGAGAVVYGAAASILGVGIGALLRNQIAAVIAAVMWFFLLEALLSQFSGGVSKWLPGGAAAALAGPGALGAGGSTGMVLLSAAGGAALYLAYTAVAAIAGTAVLQRRDIV